MTRRGYTLVELMVATAISVIVLVSVFSCFLTAQRMLKISMAESELALASRELREKLLFRTTPTIEGVHCSGLLSGTNSSAVVDSSGVVLMSSVSFGDSLADMSSQSIRLLVSSSSFPTALGGTETRYYLVNDHTPNKDAHKAWLWPGRMSLTDVEGGVVGYDKPSTTSPLTAVYRLYFDLFLKANVSDNDGSPIIRKERVSVPLFGKVQPMGDQEGGY